MYVICRNQDNKYVAMTGVGTDQSYTKNLAYARKYTTHEAAKIDSCGNEHVVNERNLPIMRGILC